MRSIDLLRCTCISSMSSKIYHVVQREIDYAIFSLLTCIIYREISRLQLTIYLVIRKIVTKIGWLAG